MTAPACRPAGWPGQTVPVTIHHPGAAGRLSALPGIAARLVSDPVAPVPSWRNRWTRPGRPGRRGRGSSQPGVYACTRRTSSLFKERLLLRRAQLKVHAADRLQGPAGARSRGNWGELRLIWSTRKVPPTRRAMNRYTGGKYSRNAASKSTGPAMRQSPSAGRSPFTSMYCLPGRARSLGNHPCHSGPPWPAASPLEDRRGRNNLSLSRCGAAHGPSPGRNLRHACAAACIRGELPGPGAPPSSMLPLASSVGSG
jgi:hypothetical protein